MNTNRWAKALFREPSGDRKNWLLLLGGIFIGAISFIGVLGYVPRNLTNGSLVPFVVLGLALASMGGAELLPKRRRHAAAAVRVLTFIGFGLFALLFFPDALR